MKAYYMYVSIEIHIDYRKINDQWYSVRAFNIPESSNLRSEMSS